ncbi:hypothetical protein Tco_1399982 [Tanacetum coccineum]
MIGRATRPKGTKMQRLYGTLGCATSQLSVVTFLTPSSFKFRRSLKDRLGHAFTVRIRTGNQNQTSFHPSVPHEMFRTRVKAQQGLLSPLDAAKAVPLAVWFRWK